VPTIQNAPSLTELAREVREACQAARQSSLTALDHIFRAGEALNKAQKQVTGNWKRWLRESCSFGVSTALLYQRIARHRAEIEVKAKEDPNFSLRVARQLLTKEPKGATEKQKAPPRPKSTLQAAWNAAAPSERSAVLARMPLHDLLQSLPPSFRARFYASGEETPDGEPFLKASEVLRRALSLLKTPSEPNTNEALTALRLLNGLLANAGIDEVTIVQQHAKERRRTAAKERRRAA
jgi:hypothetical protein